MSQGRATEVLMKAWQEMPGSGLQVRIVDESGLPFTNTSAIPSKIVDADGESPSVDHTVDALNVINVLHHEIHEGEAYAMGSIFLGIADNANADILIKPIGSSLHATFFGTSEGNAEARLLENPTIGDSGTQITPVNKNRTTSNESSSEIWTGPTVTSEGTVLYAGLMGGGTKNQTIGGAAEERDEIILNDGSLYITRITNKAGTAKNISIGCLYYEVEV